MSVLPRGTFWEVLVNDPQDRELGMKRKITRRDFLNGVRITASAALLPPIFLARSTSPPKICQLLSAGADRATRQPSGIIRCGALAARRNLLGFRWQARRYGELYDLIIVGGGISGLSAAHFYRKVVVSVRAFSSWITTTTLAVTRSAMNFVWAMRFALDSAARFP